MYKLSVIIPVYNSEEYILRCLKSIINQKLGKDKIEIIVVNDGSKDNSEAIIRTFIAKEEKRQNVDIKYFSKENGGLSDARNYGIERAKGEYLSFVDADDYIKETLYEDIFNAYDNFDLLKFKAIKVDSKGNEIERFNGPCFEDYLGEDGFEKLYGIDNLVEPAWLYIYNKEFFKKNNFKFAVGRYHEDFGLTPYVILKSKSMYSIDYYGYYYVQNDNSITTDRDEEKIYKRAEDILYFYDEMIKSIDTLGIDEKSKENLKIYHTNILILEVENLKNRKHRRKYIRGIKKRKIINNIKIKNFKQLLKKILLKISIRLYLKLRTKD